MDITTSVNSDKKTEFSKFDIIKSRNTVFFNTSFDKNTLKDLVFWFLHKYGEKSTINFLESLKTVGFHQATEAGISLGIEDLKIPPDKPWLISKAQISSQNIERNIVSGSLTSVEKSQCLIDTWNQTSDTLRQTAIQNFKRTNILNPVYMMAFSGARGNVSQVRQLVGMRGLMADPQGGILEFPIQSNFREGLTITEYLISCYGARKGLVDTALRTATSGYLTRRLVDSAQQAVISMHDCGTSKGRITEGKNLKNRLVGRVLAQSVLDIHGNSFSKNHIISQPDAKLIAKHHNQILIRSPLTCEATTSVCQLCYGWNLATGKLVQLGEAVGVIAAQSIGEPGTQLTMRTFHTGGVGVFSNQTLKPIYAPYKGKIIFNGSIPGHFIRTPYGKIAYMIKPGTEKENRIILQLESSSKVQRKFILRQHDLTPGSLLFVKNGENVEAKQLLIQISYVKILKQKLPETSHPVYSPIEGQIFFESMKLIIEKEIRPESEKNFFSSNYSGTRKMKEIGSFWVFEGSNQHEIHSLSSFLEPGDLVSKKTILFNYEFYSLIRAQLQKIHSKLVEGFHQIQIPIISSKFQNTNYLLKTRFGPVVYYKNVNHQKGLIWYPVSSSNQFLYKYISPLYTNLYKKEFNYFNENLTTEIDQSRQKFGTIFTTKPLLNLDSNQFSFVQSNILLKKFYPEFWLRSTSQRIQSNFVEKFSKTNLSTNFSFTHFNEIVPTNAWVIIFPTSMNISQKEPAMISVGSMVNSISIPKKYIRFKTLFNVKASSIKNIKLTQPSRSWYSQDDLIPYRENQNIAREVQKNSSFQYQFKHGIFWYSRKSIQTSGFLLASTKNRYNECVNLSIIQSLNELQIHNKKTYKKIFSNFLTRTYNCNPRSSLFSKQKPTDLKRKGKLRVNLHMKFDTKLLTDQQENLCSVSNLVKISCSTRKNSSFPKTYFNFQNLMNNGLRGLTVFQYSLLNFSNPTHFSFFINSRNWISDSHHFTRGTVKVNHSGEFLFKSRKNTGTYNSIIKDQHLLTIKSENPNKLRIGDLIRWGDEFESGKSINSNGQIIKKNKTNITLRLGRPFLASARGIVHIFQNDLVFKNDLLITLKSRQLQTEDIVQGIPKIEQLFEARESQSGEILSDTAHTRLKNSFLSELKSLENQDWSYAVEKSFLEAQQFLVEKILEAYENQGVKISEKHVEVIVRQMTNRVRILQSGDTGLLPGELVQHSWIKKFNKQMRIIGLREALYEPLVLGISKSVLQSESFLLAASFQEVSRVLVKSALSKKRDFLHGLHENVIVGQLIPAGTGLISHLNAQNLVDFDSQT